jgi:hypothetical protein
MEVSSPEESVFRLFEPDLITPEQHRDRVMPECTDQPEVRLMLAVMEDAVATYQRYAVDPGRRNQRLFEEAQSWIESTDTSWPYSFENICTALRMEPEILRRGLETWREKQPSPSNERKECTASVPAREREKTFDHAARSPCGTLRRGVASKGRFAVPLHGSARRVWARSPTSGRASSLAPSR